MSGQMRRPRGIVLTDKGRHALGVGPRPTVDMVGVPLLDLPYRHDQPREGHDEREQHIAERPPVE